MLLSRDPLDTSGRLRDDDLEALIKEARRRARRRRAMIAALVLAVAGLVTGLTVRAAGPRTARPRGHGGASDLPYVDPRAFHGSGELAFVSRGRLFVLDGATDSLVAVSRPAQQASDPQFSPDGRWLIYSATSVGTTEEWLARGDGSAPRSLTPAFDDDSFDAKVEIVCGTRPPIASFTFACPSAELVRRLHDSDIAVWVTVTEVDEALAAVRAGADALIVQGVEAGGHRGSFEDTDGRGEVALLPLLRLVARSVELPLIASGGIGDGAAVAAVLAAGARAAQLGSAFMRCREAATSAPHREALSRRAPTALTRAFSGRRARGIVNGFMREHDEQAPAAYPHVNQLTAPLRAAARQAGDAEAVNLWAGQAYQLAETQPAGELVGRLSADARTALEHACASLLA